jgi:hypothetical protein
LTRTPALLLPLLLSCRACSPGAGIVTVGADPIGAVPCPAGAASVAGSDASEDCSDLRAGYWYTGAGAIATDTVVQCPEDFYCDGTATITVGIPTGRTACPVGSGSTASTTSISIAACTKIYPGYYYDGDATCSSGIQATGSTCVYRVCDDPTKDAFCPGGAVTDVKLDAGRTTCNFGTRTYCDVGTGLEGIDCTKNEHCISPP